MQLARCHAHVPSTPAGAHSNPADGPTYIPAANDHTYTASTDADCCACAANSHPHVRTTDQYLDFRPHSGGID
jgi:hypothetical protein